jgi:hypothetical protein
MYNVGCSAADAVGRGGAMFAVGRTSDGEASASTSAVPSSVQKLSHSSEKV